jgi:2-aminoadipate transaminase
VPGQAAYVDGRGANSMRLNFSGVSEDEIREGVARIGRVIKEQVDLYETLAPGSPVAEEVGRAAREAAAESAKDDGATSNVFPLRKEAGA